MTAYLRKRKKKGDIFAPSQAIQDAKSKIGPAYFDVSLLECSQNAVELTQLVSKWDDLEKEKVKSMRDITREQNIMLRSLKAHNPGGDESDLSRVASIEGVETLDGKRVAPGFRFKSNGDIKPSTLALPLIHLDDTEENTDIAMSSKTQLSGKESFMSAKNSVIGLHRRPSYNQKTNVTKVSGNPNMSTKHLLTPNTDIERRKSEYDSINYEKEIKELEHVLLEIHNDLNKSKIKLSASNGTDPKTYLRAHKNEYVSTTNISQVDDYKHPNDRFAFQPGSTTNMYKQRVKTPSHRTCVGCQCKLKQAYTNFQIDKKSRSMDICKRKWNFAPQGKYVQASISYKTATRTSQNRTSKRNKSIVKTSGAKSVVHFQTKNDVSSKRSVSMNDGIPIRDANYRCQTSPSINSQRLRDGTASSSGRISSISNDMMSDSERCSSSRMSARERCLSSSLSLRSGLSSSRLGSQLLNIDYEARMEMLKALQAEENKTCEKKISAFLQKFDQKQVETPSEHPKHI